MKTYTNNKIIISGFIIAVTVFAIVLTSNVYAQQGGIGGTPSAPAEVLEKSGNLNGGPTVAQLQLAPKNNQPSSLGTSTIFGTSLQKIFRLMGSSIFDTVVAYRDTAVNMLYAGFSTQQPPAGGFGSAEPKLQVNGSIMVKSLAQTGAAPKVPVCTNDAGILARCASGGGGGIGGMKP